MPVILSGSWRWSCFISAAGERSKSLTYNFPVRIKVVKGATIDRIFRNDPTLLDDFIAAGEELMQTEFVP